MGKLVRDRIPEIIRADGGTPDVRVLDADDYETALHDKLFEEAAELRAADADDRLEEAADVLEVLLALATLNGFTLEDIVSTAKAKFAERGGFEDRLWLDGVGVPRVAGGPG
ncbi:nucleoside triphosphate pyrophosphohydrolase [Nocardia lijiangensis]|uniref:nucleoside triphosphate pyrophosphohydrolase n=1 Tax=Nocardia lijiangensis TaxID=299618 RepID=UPI003D75957D